MSAYPVEQFQKERITNRLQYTMIEALRVMLSGCSRSDASALEKERCVLEQKKRKFFTDG